MSEQFKPKPASKREINMLVMLFIEYLVMFLRAKKPKQKKTKKQNKHI